MDTCSAADPTPFRGPSPRPSTLRRGACAEVRTLLGTAPCSFTVIGSSIWIICLPWLSQPPIGHYLGNCVHVFDKALKAMYSTAYASNSSFSTIYTPRYIQNSDSKKRELLNAHEGTFNIACVLVDPRNERPSVCPLRETHKLRNLCLPHGRQHDNHAPFLPEVDDILFVCNF